MSLFKYNVFILNIEGWSIYLNVWLFVRGGWGLYVMNVGFGSEEFSVV